MRRLIVGGVLTASLLLVPATPAAAETTVDPNGNVVTITIPVDVVGAEGKTSPDGTMSLVDYWEKILNDTWGAAFDKTSYKSCYRFELNLKLTAQGRNFDSTKGRHRILVSAPTGGLTFDGTGFEGAPETSRDHTTGDGTRSLEHDRDGAIPVDAAPAVIAHEFGHLFGLGQDSDGSAPAPGYDVDDVMVGGVPGVDLSQPPVIDKKVIDRLGKIIERYLKDQGKKLPKCQAWTGPIRTTHSQSVAGVSCTAEENGTVTLAVVDDAVSGTIETSGSRTCTGPASSITEPTAVVIRLTGTFEDREFRLGYSEVIGSVALTPSCLSETPIEIPVERGTGSAELTAGFGAGDTTTCNITVERQSDDEAVG